MSTANEEPDGPEASDVAWWRSWKDKQVHAFVISGLTPESRPTELIAVCGHVAPLNVIEPTSAGMPCVLCVAKAPVVDQQSAGGAPGEAPAFTEVAPAPAQRRQLERGDSDEG